MGGSISLLVFKFFIKPEGGRENISSLELLDGEQVIRTLKPHPFAFYDMYLIWMWVIFLSVLFLNYGSFILTYTFDPLAVVSKYVPTKMVSDNWMLKAIPGVDSVADSVSSTVSPALTLAQSYSSIALWVCTLLLSSLLISAFKIEFKWVLAMVGVGVLSSATAYYLDLKPEAAYYFAIIYSFFGMFLVELYRRAHTFYITNFRIVTEVNFITHKRNELSYDKINNVVLDQGLIASIFNFGTIIPVTASGLGMGSDFSSVSVGGAGPVKGNIFLGGQITGGRSIQTPRVRSMYSLFGVKDPDEIHKIIIKHLHEFVNAPYLQRMTEQLQILNEKLK